MNQIRLIQTRITRHSLEQKRQQHRAVRLRHVAESRRKGLRVVPPHTAGHLHAGHHDFHFRIRRARLCHDRRQIFLHLRDRQTAQSVIAAQRNDHHVGRPLAQHQIDPPQSPRRRVPAQAGIDHGVIEPRSLDFLLQQRRVSLFRFQIVTGRDAVTENDHTARLAGRRRSSDNGTEQQNVKTSAHMNSQQTTEPAPAKSEMTASILAVRGLGKTYTTAGHPLTVLADINFDLAPGAPCAIVGPSGSGKTTLLGLCAGLDRPTTGQVVLDGHHLGDLDEDALAALRNATTGFVFQSFQLLPSLTALENVLVPLELRGVRGAQATALDNLARVGLADRTDHYPNQLSGGEQQRVALARAFVHRPKILFADEPTGNLDDETSGPIVDMLFDLNATAGTALVLVTHDPELARRAGRVITMRGGRILSDA